MAEKNLTYSLQKFELQFPFQLLQLWPKKSDCDISNMIIAVHEVSKTIYVFKAFLILCVHIFSKDSMLILRIYVCSK